MLIMFLGQTKFPSWAQRNSIAHLVPFSPGTMGIAQLSNRSLNSFIQALLLTHFAWNVEEIDVFDNGQTS